MLRITALIHAQTLFMIVIFNYHKVRSPRRLILFDYAIAFIVDTFLFWYFCAFLLRGFRQYYTRDSMQSTGLQTV